ncbi:MAG: class I SAM-dependent methyltransferase [Candidatus Methylacidiphilales bacterium]|nr:class I SAM-dependent methyltransferase [Candidatus Methylacidiphilales bacterium]
MDVTEKEQMIGGEALAHWYYKAKFALLLEHLRSLPLDPERFTCVDVGSGLGLFLHKLEQVGLASPARSLGVDPVYAQVTTALNSRIEIHPSFLPGKTYDLAIMMDVLEHVPDDQKVLSDSVSRVSKNGYVFITVPALPFLYSSHDRFLGHYRRYTIASLRRLLESEGRLEILRTHYFFASILPLAVPVRMRGWLNRNPTSSDMKTLPVWAGVLLERVCRWELSWACQNRLAGLSVVALCRVCD